MSNWYRNLLKISHFLVVGYGLMGLAATANGANILMIGRPAAGKINFDQASKNFSSINDQSQVIFVDPNSQGELSVCEYFPCQIPPHFPQKFAIVCLENGMLNEVALSGPQSAGATIGSSGAPIHTQQKLELQKLQDERDVVYTNWQNLKGQREAINKDIINKWLKRGLLNISIESGETYYGVQGWKNTCSSTTIVAQVINKKNSLENPEFSPYVEDSERELEGVNRNIDQTFQEMSALDIRISELNKLSEQNEENRESEQVMEAHLDAPRQLGGDPCRQIEQMLQAAWQRVASEGIMIVFSGDAQIPETPLAEGISTAFLRSTLPNDASFEEHFFPEQGYEGQNYIANPAIPAVTNVMGWEGSREPGSYFVIRKLSF